MESVRHGLLKLGCLVILLCPPLIAQQSIPDAPKPKNAPQGNQFPEDAPPAPKNEHTANPETAPPQTPVTSPKVQRGEGIVTDRSQLPGFSAVVNFVQVPVTVRDSSGRLVPDLRSTDFTVYEDGVPQRLNVFITDPFPLSAAVVVDTELPSGSMKKVNESLPALVGAFSEFDEVALFRYGHTVAQATGFSGAANVTAPMLARVQRPGREGGPPAVFGPIAQGPSINGHPVGDPNAQTGTASGVPAPVHESYVLNDAILRAAQELAKRDRTRRKIIFVVSDGRELGSVAGYDQVRKVLLANNITVYALGVDTAALPIYDKLNRIRFPGFGYGNILPRYVSDTAGDMQAQFDRQSIELAYAKITETARNQYTLGYNAKATAVGACRTIDVHVHRPNLSVTAKTAYCPLPPQAQPQSP